MKYYVKINGVSSETIQGLKISELPSISKPLCRSTREEIDGRDGDIITKLGYSAYDKTLKIGLWGNYDINQVIAFFNQEGKITFSNEPDKYYIFTILNRADFINQLEAFRTASITIHCQPFKYMEQPSPDFDREYVEETGTDLTFNNSVEAPIDIDLKGNTNQNTLSGKNLLDLSNTQTSFGITSNYNTATGAFSFSGKTTTTYSDLTAFIDCNLPIGSYNFSLNKSFSKNFHLILKFNDNSTRDINLVAGNTNISFTTDKVAIQQRIYAALNNNTNYDETFYIQLESGSTATSFERYCGGIPSPNPNYPQNVNVVSGDNEIKVENSTNVFSMRDYASNNSAYYSYSRDNGLIMLKNDDRAFGSINLKINVEGNKTYYLKTTSNLSFAISEYNSSDTWIKNDNLTSETRTFTTNANCSYIKFKCSSSGLTYPYTIGNIYISQNNNYEVSTYNIDLPVENLFDSDTLTFIEGYISSTGQYMEGFNNGIMQFINVLPNTTYTISLNTTIREIVISEFNGNTWIKRTSSSLNVSSFSITTGSSTNKLAIVFSKNTTTTMTKEIIVAWQPMLELGSKPNTYTPYGTTPIELNKIGTYQDYIYKEDDKWYLHKEIGKVVLNGSENWLDRSASGRQYFTIAGSSHKREGLCFTNYYSFINSINTSIDYGIRLGGAEFTQIVNVDITSVADFKTWLNTHNTIVYYQLLTPTNTEITYQPLINQLNAIEDAESYEGTTNISQINNDLPFIITASVLCGAAKFIVNNIGNTIAKPIMTIEGSGNIGIYLNDIQMFTIALGDEGSITLDIANMEAYKDGILKNRLVVGDYNSFVLQPGNNTISFSGDVVECEIKNYSRWL